MFTVQKTRRPGEQINWMSDTNGKWHCKKKKNWFREQREMHTCTHNCVHDNYLWLLSHRFHRLRLVELCHHCLRWQRAIVKKCSASVVLHTVANQIENRYCSNETQLWNIMALARTIATYILSCRTHNTTSSTCRRINLIDFSFLFFVAVVLCNVRSFSWSAGFLPHFIRHLKSAQTHTHTRIEYFPIRLVRLVGISLLHVEIIPASNNSNMQKKK